MPSQADMPLHIISMGRASFRLHRPPSCLDKASTEQWKRLCLGDINRQPFWMKTCLSSLKQQQWETAQGYVWQMPCNRYHRSHLSVLPVHCYIWTAFETRQNILFWQRNPEQNLKSLMIWARFIFIYKQSSEFISWSPNLTLHSFLTV